MKKLIYLISFLFLFAVPLHAQQTDTVSRFDGFDLEQMLDDLTDLELVQDAIQAWLSVDVSGFGVTANRQLASFLDFFLRETQLEIGIRQNIDTENMFWRWIRTRNPKGTFREGSIKCYIIFNLSFVPQPDDPRQYQIKIEVERKHGIEANAQVASERWGYFDRHIDSVNNSGQTHARDDFRTAVDELITGGLFILLGIDNLPLAVNIQPLYARAIDSRNPFSLNAPYEWIVVGGNRLPVTNVSLRRGDRLSLQTFVNRMGIELDTVERIITLSNGRDFNHQLKSTDTTISTFYYMATMVGNDVITATHTIQVEGRDVVLIAGQLNISVFDEIRRNVRIVPLQNNFSSLNQRDIQNFLDSVYRQAVVSWNVTLEPPFTESGHRGRLGLARDPYSNFSSDMNRIISTYRNHRGVVNETYYIFVVSDIEDFRNYQVLGYMPLNSNFGFVAYDNISSERMLRTIAHELGHGTFRLRHTFSEFPAMTRGMTDNLMDPEPRVNPHPERGELGISRLLQFQWDLIHNPREGVFENQDEEDMMTARRRIDYAILISSRYLSHSEIRDKNFNYARIMSDILFLFDCGAILIDCTKQVKELRRGTSPYLPYTIVYYFDEKPDLHLHPVSANRNGRLSVRNDDRIEHNAVHFWTNVGELKYGVNFRQNNPNLSYNSSGASGQRTETGFLDRSVTVYGVKQFEYRLTDRDLLPFVKSIRWNEYEAATSNLDDWITEEIAPNRQDNTITITPLFGQPVVFSVHYRPAPALTVSNVFTRTNEGSVGLDNWELFRGINNNPAIAEFYTEKYTVGGNQYFLPMIILTPYAQGNIEVTMRIVDGSSITTGGLAQYRISITSDVKALTSGTLLFDIPISNINTNEPIRITDMRGNLKGKIGIVTTAVNDLRRYRVVKFEYRSDKGGRHIVSDFNVGRLTESLNPAFAQLGIGWNRVATTTITITDRDITADLVHRTGLSIDDVKKYLSGTRVEANKRRGFQQVLGKLYEQKVANNRPAGTHDIVFMPHNIGVNGFAAMNYYRSFISPNANPFTVVHELGHNLGLRHIGRDLGICDEEEAEGDPCELRVRTNNIMGYINTEFTRNSFWRWQRYRIRGQR